MTKILNFSFLFILVLHVLIACGFELAHDEAYYWLYSQYLDWGYFDHPPVVAILIKLFSFLPHSEVGVRMGFILVQLCAVMLVMGMVVKSRRWLAMMLFFSFPLASFSGLFALPDLPLLFSTALYCFLLKRYLEKHDAISVVGLSLSIPLLLYSKYHGILVVFFTILALPGLLKRKDFYLIALGSILLFLPHVLWQYKHDFSTLKYHFFERPKVDFSLIRLLNYSATQVFLAGLFAGPLVWWTTFKTPNQDSFLKALKWICFGTFFFFLFSTFSKKFEANWTIFLTPPLIILTLQSALWEKKWVRVLLIVSLIPVFSSRFLLVFNPEVLPIKRLHEFHGWKDWSRTINDKCTRPIMANTYQVASKLSFYLRRPIHALNFNSRKNQFDYWLQDPVYYLTKEVCYVTDKKRFTGEIILTPEGKTMRIVPDFKPSELKADSP